MIRDLVDAIHSLFTMDRAECVWQEEPGEAGSNTHSRLNLINSFDKPSQPMKPQISQSQQAQFRAQAIK